MYTCIYIFTEKKLASCNLFNTFYISARIRDPGNADHTLRDLRICLRDMNCHPPQALLVKKILHDAVASAQPPDNAKTNVITIGDYDLQLSSMYSFNAYYYLC